MTCLMTHNLYLPYKGEFVEVAIISIIGDKMERYKHPSVLEAGMTRKAFTVSQYALNLVSVKHDYVANKIPFASRFLFSCPRRSLWTSTPPMSSGTSSKCSSRVSS